MDEKELARALEAEGFRRTYVWQDGPEVAYPDHTHSGETAHIVLSGEMTVTMCGEGHTYRAGERCDVPAGRYTLRGWERRVAAMWLVSAEPGYTPPGVS